MRKFFMVAMVAAVALIASSSSADAGFRIRATSSIGGEFLNVSDNGSGDILNLTNGVILGVGMSSGATLNVNTASSKPAIGSAAAPELALNFSITQFAGGLAQTITIEVTDTDFTPVTTGPLVSSIGGTLSSQRSTVTDNSYAGANSEFSTVGPTVQLGTFSGPPDNFSGSAIFGPAASAPYSLTKKVTIVLGEGGLIGFDVSGNAKISATPAPAGLLLALTALPALGLGALRRRRQVKASV